MKHPAEFLIYADRLAANENRDYSGDGETVEDIRRGRDRTAKLLSNPDLKQEIRDLAEMHLAKVNRWLRRRAENHRRFNQALLTERWRLP